jgi:hypothetical protein
MGAPTMFAKKFYLIRLPAVAIVLAWITSLFCSLSVKVTSSGGHFDPLLDLDACAWC